MRTVGDRKKTDTQDYTCQNKNLQCNLLKAQKNKCLQISKRGCQEPDKKTKHGSKHPNPEEGARQRSEVLCPPRSAIRRINQRSRFKCHSHTPAASAGSHTVIKEAQEPSASHYRFAQNVSNIFKMSPSHNCGNGCISMERCFVTKKVGFFSSPLV